MSEVEGIGETKGAKLPSRSSNPYCRCYHHQDTRCHIQDPPWQYSGGWRIRVFLFCVLSLQCVSHHDHCRTSCSNVANGGGGAWTRSLYAGPSYVFCFLVDVPCNWLYFRLHHVPVSAATGQPFGSSGSCCQYLYHSTGYSVCLRRQCLSWLLSGT